jgi:hypothetical protein
MTTSVAPHRESKSNGPFYVAAGIAILVVATAIRICGAFNDLWLDEIWSIKIAGRVSSPPDVFTKLHHEINHYFNTLWLWWVGNRGNWPGYRIPSLVAGSVAVALAGLIGLRRNRTNAFMAMFVVGFSYVMVLYSSETRGYAMTVFFSFLSYYALDCYLEKPRWQTAVLFSISSILGLVSQPIFAGFLCAAFVWSAYRLAKPFRGWKPVLAGLLPCHAAPFVFLAILYWIDIRKIVAGGGTPSPSLIGAYGTALAWGLGMASSTISKFLMCVAAAAIFYAGIRLLWNEKSDAPIFFAGVIAVFPVLLIIIRGSNVIYTRHFIIAIAFLLILFSYILASLYDRGGPYRIGCVVLLAIYFLTNGQLVMTFFKYGRGHYRDAIRFMAENTKFPRVTIGSDHDFQTTMVLEFYGREPLGAKDEKYLPRNLWPPNGPEWFVCHKESFENPTPPALQLNDNNGHQFELVKTFPSAPLCGLHWFIYHNAADGPLENR